MNTAIAELHEARENAQGRLDQRQGVQVLLHEERVGARCRSIPRRSVPLGAVDDGVKLGTADGTTVRATDGSADAAILGTVIKFSKGWVQ